MRLVGPQPARRGCCVVRQFTSALAVTTAVASCRTHIQFLRSLRIQLTTANILTSSSSSSLSLPTLTPPPYFPTTIFTPRWHSCVWKSFRNFFTSRENDQLPCSYCVNWVFVCLFVCVCVCVDSSTVVYTVNNTVCYSGGGFAHWLQFTVDVVFMTVLKQFRVKVCGVRVILRVMFVWRHCVSLEGKTYSLI